MKTGDKQPDSYSSVLPKDSYNWLIKDGEYIPANRHWQPLDLSPVRPPEAPWPGDICYAYMPDECQNCPSDLPVRQLVYVRGANENQKYAWVHLISTDVESATKSDVILGTDVTGIPFEIVVSLWSNQVFYDQISKPIGATDQPMINRLNAYFEGELTKQQLTELKRGNGLATEDDGMSKFVIMSHLSCFCLNSCLQKCDEGMDGSENADLRIECEHQKKDV